MNTELKRWSVEDKESLIELCNGVKRDYLTDRLPCPYTEKDAEWWLDIIRITGLAYHPNTASRRVLEKNGFALEGIMKDAVVKGENAYDLCIYGRLKRFFYNLM